MKGQIVKLVNTNNYNLTAVRHEDRKTDTFKNTKTNMLRMGTLRSACCFIIIIIIIIR